MNQIKNKNKSLVGLIMILIFSSCNIGGLELQTDDNHIYTPIATKINMTAYEFIETRKTVDLSLLYEAINMVQYKDSFEKDNRTYVVLNDVAFSAYLAANRFSSVQSMTKTQIKTLLNKYIVHGKYLSTDLTTTPLVVETAERTVKLTFYLRSVTLDTTNKYQVLIGLFGSTAVKWVVTSNLQPTNGVMHIIESYF